MKKLLILIIIPVFTGISAFSQMYILNEDFSGAAGTTPPAGWNINVITGNATDLWHFDNPGMQEVLFPVTEPFAIFDSEHSSANGAPETVALETPLFDASLSNFILLNFHHRFEPGSGGQGKVEAYDGNAWQQITTFTTSSLNPESEILDLSGVVGGITNARLRFTWSGNGSGFWALDNIRIYASQPLDGGMVSIDDPTSPVVPGIQNVVVTLGNFGYNTITSATINWSANGVAQAPYTWNGSAGFGQSVGNITIGSYNFQNPVLLRVWLSNPNGQPDPNPYNDTITKYVQAALCGTYTIGGAGADYASFGAAAAELNAAGITCPVTFLVRNGTYTEQFILRDIPGTSETNTITFRSESGDSTQAVLQIVSSAQKYEPMIFLDGTRHLRFEDLGFMTGSTVSYANSAVLMEGAESVTFTGCFFETRNQFDFGLTIQAGSKEIEAGGNRFRAFSGRAGAVKISGAETHQVLITQNRIKGATEWGHATIVAENGANNILIGNNTLDSCYQAVYLKNAESVQVSGNVITKGNDGVFIDDNCRNINVSGNRITMISTNQNISEGNSAITLEKSDDALIYNNFLHTTGERPARGISIYESDGIQVSFNSVHITNTDAQSQSIGLLVFKSNGISGRNNIFSVKTAGIPVSFDQNTAVPDLDRNDYYAFDGTIGLYQQVKYTDLEAWQAATGSDPQSLSVTPFFNSDTDLSINQALLNDAGTPVSGIETDIDGTPRNAVTPDIGAKEYTPCSVDAGVNAIVSPVNPLAGGTAQVVVRLQNQGTASLTSALLHWEVNGQAQPNVPWSGSLPAGANVDVTLGSYVFEPGTLYTIRSRTSAPNGATDCNPRNDTISSAPLAAPLCGTYTIGGTNPDFVTFSQAVSVLNQAGVTCAVTFLVRDGEYRESLAIGTIPGASASSTVTFRSESGDSSKAVLRIRNEAQKFETMVALEGARYLRFRELGFLSGAQAAFNNNIFLLSGVRSIHFEQCYFEPRKNSDMAILVEDDCQELLIRQNRFACKDTRAFAIYASGNQTRDLTITDNIIKGTTDWNYATIKLGNYITRATLTGNQMDSCFRAIQVVDSDSILISGNLITRSNEGIYLDNFCTGVEVSGNRLLDMLSHVNSGEGTEIIASKNTTGTRIFNNYIHASGGGPATGLVIQQSNNCLAAFNSIHITNTDGQGKSIGIRLNGGNGITLKNNISSLARLGSPVFIDNLAANSDIDHNDYFSPLGVIGKLRGQVYTSLETWADSLGQDENSMSDVPFFTSDTDLSINQILLNNAGTPVPGINTDINGLARNASAPDIGATEYNPCAPDAGINAITAPTSPLSLGPETVRVILQNQGTVALTSAKVHWAVNDEVQAAFAWTGNLSAGQNTEVSIGNYTFVSGRIYRVTAWTGEPNGAADCNPENDTISSLELAAPLCGTYTIGGDNPDFTSVGQAATVLNEAGITCPVVMVLRDGTYEEQFTLSAIAGSSETNTVTFRSESGDSSRSVIRLSPTAIRFEPLMLLEGTRFVHFEHLGFITGAVSGSSNPVALIKGGEQITFTGCSFELKKESDIALNIQAGSKNILLERSRIVCSSSQAAAVSVQDAGTEGITVSGNVILGNALGGNTLLRVRNDVRKVEITSNEIENAYRAIYAIGVDSLKVSGNRIRNVNDGIYIDDLCKNVEVSANHITRVNSHQNAPDGTSGIFIRRCNGLELINNFVQTQGQGPVIGISLQLDTNTRVIFNSVNITNTDLQAKSKGIYVTKSDGYYFRNNLLSVKTDGLPLHLDQDVTGISFDYNNYHHPAGIVGRIGTQNYSSLNTWGQAVNGDANAKTVNPFFKADTIPLPFQRALNGAGIPIAGILFDIEGKLRFSQAPDIGCLEFFVDYGVLELLSPTLNCFHPDVDSVIVYLRQFGDVPFNDLKVAYQLDNGPVHIDTIPGPLYEDVIHTFGTTENISTYGDYRFKIWLINTLDDNINNDTLIAMRYSKPPPEVQMDWDNFCTGWTVNFTGSATVASPYFIAGYEWLFGDGETSEEQNPVHHFQTAGTYEVTLRAYSDAGCYSDITRSIILDPDFQGLSLDPFVVGETCLGDSSGYMILSPYGGYEPYRVFVNEQLVSDTLITGLTTGLYVIRTVDAEDCARTDTVEIKSAVLLSPQIQASPLSGLTPLTVNFSFTANDPASWTWYFSETDSSTALMPEFTFLEYGTHQVILEVMSGHPHYCTETAVIDIFVDIYVSFEANNVFTPNDDGQNDYFGIRTTGINEMTVKIFNAWGNKIYEYEDLDGRWDGKTSAGAEAPDGTYFWYAEALGFDHKTYKRNGSVLLLRHAASAYPNPAREQASLKVFGPLLAPATVDVFNMMGEKMHSEPASDREDLSVDLSGLGAGLYMIRISDGAQTYFVRIIKN